METQVYPLRTSTGPCLVSGSPSVSNDVIDSSPTCRLFVYDESAVRISSFTSLLHVSVSLYRLQVLVPKQPAAEQQDNGQRGYITQVPWG